MKRLSFFTRLAIGCKALAQLGVRPLVNLAIYRLGLITGHYERLSRKKSNIFAEMNLTLRWPVKIPPKELLQLHSRQGLEQIEQILKGKFRQFGGAYVDMTLTAGSPLDLWTQYEKHPEKYSIEDIKFIWEPARFGWAIQLACAWSVNPSKSIEQAFWENFERFLSSNPAYYGPNWVSGQEAAIRLISLAFAASIFQEGDQFSSEKANRLSCSIVEHARRIEMTLPYSRSQDNNHYLIEGIGLYSAGWMIPKHPESEKWKAKGWKIVLEAIDRQIADDGAYCQHSINYHRLMLQSVLWLNSLLQKEKISFPETIQKKLAAATQWYLAQIDPLSGKAPNLGSNDGTLLLPMADVEFSDHRPTAQAAAVAFLGMPCFKAGEWDHLRIWLGYEYPVGKEPARINFTSNGVHKIGNHRSWATLRAIDYHHRPNQADQLHIDLWHEGMNLLLDAGTYRYNAPPPWENSLAGTLVHNTVTLDDRDQMSRAGKFLWLDWAQARIIKETENLISAEHDGYLKYGILHRRTLERETDFTWKVLDELISIKNMGEHRHRLHWLLADGRYTLMKNQLVVTYPETQISFSISSNVNPVQIQLIRAGVNISGKGGSLENLGWFSPTYGEKVPTLSFLYEAASSKTVEFFTLIHLDK